MANVLHTTESEEPDRPISSAIPDVQSDQATKPPTEPHMGQLQPPKLQHIVRVIGVPLVLVLLLAGAVLWLGRSTSDGSSNTSDNSAVATVTAADTGKSLAVLDVTNPGFEEGFDGWVAGFAMWEEIPNSHYEVVIDTAIAHQGQSSAAIMPIGADMYATNYGAITYKMEAKELRGKRVRYSAYVKAENIISAGLLMEVHGIMEVPSVDGPVRTDSSFPLRYEGMNGRRIKGTVDWGRYEVVVDVPEEAEFIVFGLHMWSEQGRVWLDDVQLEIVREEVALTCRGNEQMTGNSDFEHESGREPHESWRALGQQLDFYTYHAGTSPQAAYEGELGAYLRVDKPALSPDLYALFSDQIDVSCLKGRKVAVSLYTNADAVDGRAVLWASVQYGLIEDGYNAEGDHKTSPWENYLNKEITIWPSADAKEDTKQGWQRQELMLDIPYTAVDFQIGIRLYGEGEIWIDNVKVDAR